MTEAKEDNNVVLTDRALSPFTKAFNGQVLALEETKKALKQREESVFRYYERKR